MKWIFSKYGININLKDNQVGVLSIENQKAFAEIVSELWCLSNGGEGELVVSIDNEPVKFSKYAEFVTNPFSLDVNNKKVLSKLYSQFETELIENHFEKVNLLNSEIVRLLYQINEDSAIPLNFDLNLNLQSLFKMYSIQVDMQEICLLEKLENYIQIMHRVCGISIFFFLNLKEYLSLTELLELYRFVAYENLSIFILEGIHTPCLDGESCSILDQDLCLINL